MTAGILIHGDTHRSAALRHELPLGILDPFPYFEVDGRRVAVLSSLETERVRAAAPGVEVIDPYELGLDDLMAQGLRWDELDIELCARAAAHLGLDRVVVPSGLGVGVADRLRADAIEVVPDEREFIRRRRSKNAVEIEGVRRAQVAADAAMGAAAEMLRAAERHDAKLHLGGEPLTAEAVRARIREACAERGAPAAEDIIVAGGAAGASGHEKGSGPLPAGAPIVIDIWPRDEGSGCFADMARTFVAGGEPAPDVAAWHTLVRTALERVYEALAPGATGRDLFAIACEVFERAGEPTQRTKGEGEVLENGFIYSLGHGVGLEVHEEPTLGLTGADPLVPGDVVAIEPSCYRKGYGGVCLEDLVLITDDGFERLTDFRYDLMP
jgi:Xaa-Pro aminopeptidase